jgi:hypothetical protein
MLLTNLGLTNLRFANLDVTTKPGVILSILRSMEPVGKSNIGRNGGSGR